MNNPFTLLPPTGRKYVYAGFGLVALIVGGIDVFYGDGDPSWVEQVQNVLAFLAVPIGVLAASNTPGSQAELIAAVKEEVADPSVPTDRRGSEFGAAGLLLVGVVLAFLGLLVLLLTGRDTLGLILLVVGVLVSVYGAVQERGRTRL